jgi:DNA-binding response OmpR family regulator
MPDEDRKVRRLCRRCGEEIELANDLDRECDIDRHRRIISVGGQPRQLTPMSWHLFTLLYRRRGTVVSSKAILRRQRENLRQLRKVLVGSRYEIVNHRDIGYELIVTPEHLPERTTARPCSAAANG